jgi:hypothetical protein
MKLSSVLATRLDALGGPFDLRATRPDAPTAMERDRYALTYFLDFVGSVRTIT